MSKPNIWGHPGKRLENKDLLIKYLERSTVQVGGCWIFNGGSKTRDGYRRIRIDGQIIGIHRLSAYIFKGLNLSDSNQQANHISECSSKVCWNPEHLYIGTHKENIQDYLNSGHYNSKKEYCIRGHRISGIRRDGRRYCKVCVHLRYKRNT